MNSRRNFLKQSSLATTAIFLLKPLQTLASGTSVVPVTGNARKLAFLHTANNISPDALPVIRELAQLRKRQVNAILINATDPHLKNSSLAYDASVAPGSEAAFGQYKIINRNNMRTGILTANAGERDTLLRINRMATFLKERKDCQLVICLSQLGYKNKDAVDDITIASNSTHLDIIISGHQTNFHQYPVVLLNRDNKEVILHAAGSITSGYGKIEVEFDELGQKRNIQFTC